MKTKEELNELKKEVEALQGKLAELSEEELKEVSAGWEVHEYEIFLSSSNERNENGRTPF